MNEPILVIMAGGKGSRYGGLKQLDPVGPSGGVIMDYSIYDAARAGFRRFVLVIREETRSLFQDQLVSHLPANLEVRLARQDLHDLPAACPLPPGRTKPLGTAHALYAARDLLDAPFAVINADDYYGPEAFQAIYAFLREERPAGDYAMIAFYLGKTLTEYGSVNRGICQVEDGMLVSVRERTQLFRRSDPAGADPSGAGLTSPGHVATDLSGAGPSGADQAGASPRGADATGNDLPQAVCREGETEEVLDGQTLVSMNFWGFQPDILQGIAEGFPDFYREGLAKDPLKAEFFLPDLVTRRMEAGKARVRVLESREQWMGMTYPEDREALARGLAAAHDQGLYPEKLW